MQETPGGGKGALDTLSVPVELRLNGRLPAAVGKQAQLCHTQCGKGNRRLPWRQASRIEREVAVFAAMEGVRFRVVHFNNGMHGWAYTEAQYKSAFPAYTLCRR